MVASRQATLRTELADFLSIGLATRELTLEVGCGHGHFLVRYAATFPNRLCLGVDLLRERIERANKKRRRLKAENLKFIRAEALEALDCLPSDARPTEIFVLFPDPWPKRRHHKHRILQPAFLEKLASRVGEGTRLYFRTDHVGYYNDSVRLFEQSAEWRIEPEAVWPMEEPTIFQQRADSYNSLIAVRIRLTKAVEKTA